MISFVGAGSGAPDLITVRGLRRLENADVAVYAGSLVNRALLCNLSAGCAVYDSAGMTLEETTAVLTRAAREGKNAVRLHTGDPCLYGAIGEQMRALDAAGIDYEVIPGVSSFCGAAAALKAEYTVPGGGQTVIITRMEGRTPVPQREGLRSLAAHGGVMVLFLSTGLAAEVQRELLAGGYEAGTPAAVVYKATWPQEEKIWRCTVGTLSATVENSGVRNTALLLVGDFLTGPEGRSRLYDPGFSHGFREASQ